MRRFGVKVKKLFYPVASIILVVSGLFIYLWSHITVLEKGYHFNILKKEYEGLKENNKQLKLEKAKLSSLEGVEKIAREKLGLIHPSDDQMIPVIIDEPNQSINTYTLEGHRDFHSGHR
ncbi:MAG: hypothetical protein A3G93_14070 [Nitrospinae bacterium RIFCSPLOWO2_12_FULL_45_22]|nr:MAG: hypothetical protein A3G93_14070 [Nitrospinae bacterium RIFCSPLOWO2_12_FULL_45_22]